MRRRGPGVGLRRELVLILGRNGAGKSTTIRSIMVLTPPRRGRITRFGEDATRLPPHQIAGRGLGYVPQGRRIFPRLSADENLLLSVGKGGSVDLEGMYQLLSRLRERRRHGGSQLSGGEQEMLAIAQALLLNPALLVLDDLSPGLAPLVKNVIDSLKRFRSTGESLLLVEPNAQIALPAADRVYVLDDGRVAY